MESPIRLTLGRSGRRPRTSRPAAAHVERFLALEPRCLLAATPATGSFGLSGSTIHSPAQAGDVFVHNFTISPSNDAGLTTATFNNAAITAGSNPATAHADFTGKVLGAKETANNFDFHMKELDLVVTVGSGASQKQFTAVVLNDATHTQFTNQGLDATTGQPVAAFSTSVTGLPSGQYTATLSATFKDLNLAPPTNAVTPITNYTINVDTVVPAVATVGPVSPNRNQVDSVAFTLNKTIPNAPFATLKLPNLSLTKNGNPVALDSTVLVTPVANSQKQNWTITGLSTFTAGSGTYVLTVNPAGFTDADGNTATAAGSMSTTFVENIAGPALTGVTQVATPRNTPVSSVTATFSVPVSASTFTNADISLTRNGAAVPLDNTVTVSPNTGNASSLTINGLAPFTTAGGAYVLTVKTTGVTDATGNPASGTQSTSFTVDTVQPTVTSVSPNPASGTAVVVLSKAIVPSTFDFNALTLTRNGAAVALNNTVTVSPNAGATSTSYTISGLGPFLASTGDYVLKVSAAGFRDAAGNAGTGSVSASFHKAVAGPTLLTLGPVASPRNTPVTTVPFSFSAAIRPVFNPGSLNLTRNGVSIPLSNRVDLHALDSSDTRFNITGLDFYTKEAGNYVLTLDAASFTDTLGNSATGKLSTSFTIDTTAPTVTRVTPVSNGSSPVDTATVQLSKAIVPSSFGVGALTLTRGGVNVPLNNTVTVSPSGGNNSIFTVNGLGAFTGGSGNYVLRVDAAGFRDAIGNAGVGSMQGSFTVNIPATGAPTLTPVATPRTTPVSSVTVAFAAPINPASFTFKALTLTLNGANVPLNSSVQVVPHAGSNTVFDVNGLIPFTTAPGHYVLTVNAGAVTDPAGNPGSGTSAVPFDVQLPTPPTTVPPHVIFLQRYGVHQQPTRIVLSFDEPMNRFTTGLTGNYAILEVVHGRLATGPHHPPITVTSATYDPQRQTVTLTTFPRLPLHHTFVIVVNGTGPFGVGNVFGQGLAGGIFVLPFTGIASLTGIPTTGQPPSSGNFPPFP